MSRQKKYSINKGYITQKVGGKLTIFSAEQSVLLTLNDSAALIFQGLKLNWEEGKIISKIISSFNVSEKTAIEDLYKFRKLLIEQKILICK